MAAPGAALVQQEDCLECHSLPGQEVAFGRGETRSATLDPDRWSRSAHGQGGHSMSVDLDISHLFYPGERKHVVDYLTGHGWQVSARTRPEVFAGTVTEKLMIYASGRGLEYYDAPAIRTVVREARTKDFRLSSIILGVVKSQPFQMRTSR